MTLSAFQTCCNFVYSYLGQNNFVLNHWLYSQSPYKSSFQNRSIYFAQKLKHLLWKYKYCSGTPIIHETDNVMVIIQNFIAWLPMEKSNSIERKRNIVLTFCSTWHHKSAKPLMLSHTFLFESFYIAYYLVSSCI